MKAKRALCKYCPNEIANNRSRKVDGVMKCIKVPDEVKLKLQLKDKDHEPNQSKAMASKSKQIVKTDVSNQRADSANLRTVRDFFPEVTLAKDKIFDVIRYSKFSFVYPRTYRLLKKFAWFRNPFHTP